MALAFSAGRQRIKITLYVLSALLLVTLGLSGWFAFKWYTTGDLPQPVTIHALTADPRVDESLVTKQQVDAHTVPEGQPRYISIDKLGVYNARVFAAGTDENNMLQAPDNINDATWYDKSATPGSGYGAILIDAHNGGIQRNGIFYGLNTLVKGDRITLERGDGRTYTYSVVENQSMPLEEVNKTGMQMIMESAEEDKEGLNLITCDGHWVPRYQQYDRRIMLRAVRVD